MSAKPVAPASGQGAWRSVARRLDPFVDPMVAVVAAALAWRRSRPVFSYAVFLAGALLVSGTFHYIGLFSLLMLLSLFSLATYGTRRDGLLGLGAGVVCFAGLGLAGVPDLRRKDLLLAVALLVATWAAAEALRSRRDQQRDRVRAAVTEERLRIARELTYDTVGPRWSAAPVAVLTIAAAGVFYAWLWDRSHSSWAPGISHVCANMAFDFGFSAVASTTSVSLALVAGETGVATLSVVVVLAVVLLMRAKAWQTPELTTETQPAREAVGVS